MPENALLLLKNHKNRRALGKKPLAQTPSHHSQSKNALLANLRDLFATIRQGWKSIVKKYRQIDSR